MHTYFPYADFNETAKCLSRQHLQQCLYMSYLVFKSLMHCYNRPDKEDKGSGYEYHNIGKFWTGHELDLAWYGFALSSEFIQRPLSESNPAASLESRRNRLQMWEGLIDLLQELKFKDSRNPFIGEEEFHSNFRALLLFKDCQKVTFDKWKSGGYPDHACTRNLMPKKASWKREDFLRIWEFFGRPDPAWYGQWGWNEEPNDLLYYYKADRTPQIIREIQRKIDKPMAPFLMPKHLRNASGERPLNGNGEA